ncbi:hypothetical protein GQ53DRAFT_832501 [Thozetella sp. PMI_491]|nr:hypothetical protein GQ53DRAFT_832501 [Thozetella sp. PMI_491]
MMQEPKSACECAGCACCNERRANPRRAYAIAFLLYPLVLYCILNFLFMADKITDLKNSTPKISSNAILGQQARLRLTSRGLELPLILNGAGGETKTPNYEPVATVPLEEVTEDIEHEISHTPEQQEQIPLQDAEQELGQQEQNQGQQQEELPVPPMEEDSIEEYEQQNLPTPVEEAMGSKETAVPSSKPSIDGLPGNIVKDFEDKEREADESGKPTIKTADGSTGGSPTPLFSNATQPLLAKNTFRTATRAAAIRTQEARASIIGRDGAALQARGSVAPPATESPAPSNMVTPSHGGPGGKPPKTPKKGPKHGGEGHYGLID